MLVSAPALLLVLAACSGGADGPVDAAGLAADGARTPPDGSAIDAAMATDAVMAIDAAMPIDATVCPECWRSDLYPADWTPAHTDPEGRFVHDFSWAGYHNGAAALPGSPPGLAVSVVDYGADPTATSDSTAAIQAAIDAVAAAGGGIVELPAGIYRCDGRLQVTDSGVVLRGAGPAQSKIYFTEIAGMTGKASIRFAGSLTSDLEVELVADALPRSHTLLVADATGFAVGDDLQVGISITDEFIADHDMTDTWQAFNGSWQVFLRRRVAAIDIDTTPHQISIDVPVRYPLQTRDGASVRRVAGHISECGIENLAVANAGAWDDAWNEDRAHAIDIIAAKDCWVKNVASFASPVASGGGGGHHLQSGGIRILASKRVTVADCVMEKAQNRGGGGNGYLFEISQSNEVLIRDSIARDGRHNFIQNWGFGTSGCVFLRTQSAGGRNLYDSWDPIGVVAYSETHHSLATALLVDQSVTSDGWSMVNRHDWSTGAGHTATESVFWNLAGGGELFSWQFGIGYVIGTTDISTSTFVDVVDILGNRNEGTAPEDYVEGLGQGAGLRPQSLYEDQLSRRLAL